MGKKWAIFNKVLKISCSIKDAEFLAYLWIIILSEHSGILQGFTWNIYNSTDKQNIHCFYGTFCLFHYIYGCLTNVLLRSDFAVNILNMCLTSVMWIHVSRNHRDKSSTYKIRINSKDGNEMLEITKSISIFKIEVTLAIKASWMCL